MDDDVATVLGLETVEPAAPEPGEQDAAEKGDSSTPTVEPSTPPEEGAEGDKPAGEQGAKKAEPETIPKKRFDEVYWKQKETERRAAYLEGKLEALEKMGQQPGQTSAAQPPTVVDDPEPTQDTFQGSWEDLNKAHVAWQVRQGVREEFARQKDGEVQTQAVRSKQEAQAAVQTRIDEFMPKALEVVPDLVEIAGRPGVALSVSTLEIILDASDNDDAVAANVIKYLGAKPEESVRLDRLPEGKRAIELSKLSGKIAVALGNTKKTSNAPPPISPVGGAAPGDVPLSRLSMEEYAKRRDAEERKARK